MLPSPPSIRVAPHPLVHISLAYFRPPITWLNNGTTATSIHSCTVSNFSTYATKSGIMTSIATQGSSTAKNGPSYLHFNNYGTDIPSAYLLNYRHLLLLKLPLPTRSLHNSMAGETHMPNSITRVVEQYTVAILGIIPLHHVNSNPNGYKMRIANHAYHPTTDKNY